MAILEVAPAAHFGPPREAFFDPGWFERDLDVVFRPRWQFAGHVDELATPGSFIKHRIGGYELIVCRRSDGGLAAYYNFCRHRGYPLVAEGQEKIGRTFTCQYHAWTFSKDDGACLSATRMPEGFDRGQWGLLTAWVEEFHGFVYVSLSDEPPRSVAEGAAHLLDPQGGMGGYDMDGLRLAAKTEYLINANWKVVKENDEECYHCSLNHPELARSYDPWAGITVGTGDESDLDDLYVTKDYDLLHLGRTYTQRRECNIPLPRTDGPGSFDSDECQFFWMPGGQIIFVNDYARQQSFVPIGPEQTLAKLSWYVAKDAVEGRDYHKESLIELLDVTLRQDVDLCEKVQHGLKMPNYTPGPLNLEHQAPAAAFYRWYERQLSEDARS